MTYSWDFQVVVSSIRLLLDGLIGTMLLTIVVVAFTIPLGLALSLVLSSGWKTGRLLGRAYVDFFRSSALLVVVMWFYFAFPILCGIRVSAFTAAACGLVLQNAAYLAEALRAGFAMIGKGQREAAKALALNRVQIFVLIVLPQAIRAMIPVLFNLLTEVIKGTSLAAVVAYAELSYQSSKVAIQTYRPLETYTIAALMYFLVISSLATAARWYECNRLVKR